ncbi:hypothetical protein CASFOL_034532 [Castilleja foliolosa]|uniref:Uncharacterized protein n=1 Tax=Castilleja foliolosa TaxID=1961234 RepID=A0ABD3BQ67_9LAMI
MDSRAIPVSEQGQGDASVLEVELRPQKRARTTESPNVDFGELLTRILEGVRRENELCVKRVMREVREIQEMARHVGHGLVYENARFSKLIEDPTECMETPAIDAYMRILHLSPEFAGCHPEGKGKFVVLGSYFFAFSENVPR